MRRTLWACAIILGLASPSIVAHHPFDSEYDWKKPTTVKGTVTKFEWKNPHTVLQLKGTDDKGAAAEWTVELGGPAELASAGWTRTQLKSGDQITVDGWMAKDGSKRLSAKSVTPSNGRALFAAGAMFDTGTPRERPAGSRESAATTGEKPTANPAK